MTQKRQETEVTNLSQSNLFFFTVMLVGQLCNSIWFNRMLSIAALAIITVLIVVSGLHFARQDRKNCMKNDFDAVW